MIIALIVGLVLGACAAGIWCVVKVGQWALRNYGPDQ